VERFSIASRYVHRTLQAFAVIPAGAPQQKRPLLVFLHGRSARPDGFLAVDQLFAALARAGRRAPVVVFADGGDHSYWHDRRDGRWGSYVIREVIPQAVAKLKIDLRRIAIGGISMGGFGAYDLARLNPGRFCAVGGHSPALWRSSGETAPGAFDNAADFGRHDVIRAARTQASRFPSGRLWLDAGTGDPFDPGDRAFISALRAKGVRISVHRWPGGHDDAYWSRHWGDYIRFYARALASC
jgi:S-formylglutathione hydrolase FrmB